VPHWSTIAQRKIGLWWLNCVLNVAACLKRTRIGKTASRPGNLMTRAGIMQGRPDDKELVMTGGIKAEGQRECRSQSSQGSAFYENATDGIFSL